MALTNAEKQASWREGHMKNDNGTKVRAQFIFDASTRAQLKRIGCQKGCPSDSCALSRPAACRTPRDGRAPARRAYRATSHRRSIRSQSVS
jgi:hypothetical protein